MNLAWLARRLMPYLAPLIAAEVQRQLAEQPTKAPPKKKSFIGDK